MKKNIVLLATVLLLNLSACSTEMKDNKTSVSQQPKTKVTSTQQEEDSTPIVFQGKEVKEMELISMKTRSDRTGITLDFDRILKAMERTGINKDKERIIPFLLDDEAKKNIDYQMTLNYQDDSTETYLIWLDNPKVVIARKDNPEQKQLEHYIIKGEDAKQISDLFKSK
ncbi:hypothetical protein ACW4EZ_31550 (plasmid) [Bacillus toyonensis]|uniref:hypothetical protein n=1 Tax=Bacillus cereus group TaxID=86661 RepID=UPI0007CB94E0|nr:MULTISPECIES: hypothetical protein [Bacillus cereus group]OAK33869.1 hypothetical protein A6284_28115 [Bacillus wiedmannii]PEO57861.1 hypothetical protein CN567_27130 [Bacillus toyonensis]PFX75760.1 hypothetical protein COL38_29190 [Bacillus toyonensis]PFX94957.1 hypothetical protein COL37_06400 [Bacillus toyonensis]PGB08420.1 hypothetical protein COL98_24290 [Bacillus toyonensis]